MLGTVGCSFGLFLVGMISERLFGRDGNDFYLLGYLVLLGGFLIVD